MTVKSRGLACAALLALGSSSTGAAQPPPAAAFTTPGVAGAAISPSGRYVANDQPGPSGTSVEIVDLAAGRLRHRIELANRNKLRAFNWVNDQIVLVDVSATLALAVGATNTMHSYEWVRTLAIDIESASVRTMLLDDRNRQLNTGSRLYATRTAGPDTVAMAAWDHSVTRMSTVIDTRLRDDRRDAGWVYTLFDVDARSGNGKPSAVGSPYTVEWAIGADGRAVARSDWKADSSEFAILARDGAAWKTVYRRTDGSRLDLGGLAPDSKSVLAVGDNGTDRSKVWAIALDGSGPRVFFEDPAADIDFLSVDRSTGMPIGAYVGGLEGGLHLFDPKLQARQNAVEKAFPGRRVSLVSRTSDGKRVIARVEGPSDPWVFYLVDFVTGKADIVGEGLPALAGTTLGEARALHYAARDGAQIPAYLTLPPGRTEKGLPLVVLPHGGPESHDTADFDWLSQFLATRGYAVLRPQFRGSTGFGHAHRVAGYRQWGRLMQDDVSDGVKAMIERGIADPARICIAGASYGGYAALAGAAFTPDLYACAVSINGVSDLPAMLGYSKRQTGDQSDQLAYWKDHIGEASDANVISRSPARAADNVRAPILLLHGTDDTVVPSSQSELMDRALTDAGKPHRLVKLAGEDHWLSRGETRLQVLKEMEAFLASHLNAPGD
jgi:dipeptidyl aminopeptidase/acylaminoacyl peptidase